MRRGDALARARGDVDDQAGLAAVFGRRRAVDHFKGLNRIHRDLVGKDFALLIGDGLAVHGERVFRMIAEPVEKPVRIRGDSGGCEGDQRAHGGRRAFQRDLVEKLAIDVGVRGRIIFDQIAAASTVTVAGCPSHLQG